MHYNKLPFLRIMPNGYLKQEMQEDLNSFIGNLDDLVPDLIKNDDIFGAKRRSLASEKVDVGAKDVGEGFMAQHMWWNAETQGNWIDGFYRTAMLTEDTKMQSKATEILSKYLKTQDIDGYIGIYAPDLRFKHSGENGEMWAQTVLLRALLAYYEGTNNDALLSSIIKAVDCIMRGYPIGSTNPFDLTFDSTDFSCGVGHSLMIVDVFEQVYTYTNDNKYLLYATWLYDCFSAVETVVSDVSARVILGRKPFVSHAAHTYEQVRAIIVACKTDKEKYEPLLSAFLCKLAHCITPSGGPIGDELICGNVANATTTGYEYCSLQEMLHSYVKLWQYNNDFSYLDAAEWMFYNASMGARYRTSKITNNSTISYLKTDNSYSMCEKITINGEEISQIRYKYSPTHQDAAVCCVPNAGRIYTYFIEHMWFQADNKLLKAFYGSSMLKANVHGHNVVITETSNYPYSNKLNFAVQASAETSLILCFRIPKWATKVKCSLPHKIADNVLTISKIWYEKEDFNIEFVADAIMKFDEDGDCYFTYGGMLFALEIPHNEEIVKKHQIYGFYDIHCTPKADANWDYYVTGDTKILPVVTSKDVKLNVNLFNKKKKTMENVTLVPFGNTVLRRCTFKRSK